MSPLAPDLPPRLASSASSSSQAELTNLAQLLHLRHPNIVSLLGWTLLQRNPFLLEEDCPGGDMQSLVRGSKQVSLKLNLARATGLAEGILQGLSYLHSRTPGVRVPARPRSKSPL